jgi:protein-L-isoaspartate O-methyltransferase
VSAWRQSLKGVARELIPSPLWVQLQAWRRRPRVLRSLFEVHAAMEEARGHFARSDAEGRAFVEGLRFTPSLRLPEDPFSQGYRDAQLELWRGISGRGEGYSASFERSEVDLKAALHRPFPYSTGSSHAVAEQLHGQACLLELLNVSPGQSVLEVGPGWGHTTQHLLTLGCEVTAVEVDPSFTALLERKLAPWKGSLTLVTADIVEWTSDRRFDRICFFESFHHASRPFEVLEKLRQWLAPGGHAVFAAEPIAPMEWPWGVRTDGLSLWSIWKYGWLELGFDSRFFPKALARAGLTGEAKALGGPLSSGWIAAAR